MLQTSCFNSNMPARCQKPAAHSITSDWLVLQILITDSLKYLALYTSTGRSVEAGWLAGRGQAVPAGPCSSRYTYTLSFLEGWGGQPDWVSVGIATGSLHSHFSHADTMS